MNIGYNDHYELLDYRGMETHAELYHHIMRAFYKIFDESMIFSKDDFYQVCTWQEYDRTLIKKEGYPYLKSKIGHPLIDLDGKVDFDLIYELIEDITDIGEHEVRQVLKEANLSIASIFRHEMRGKPRYVSL